MYNNVLYMYILLKSIHIKCFSKKLGGQLSPHATTLEPPLPLTRFIAAAPHRDPVGTVVVVHLSIIEGRTPIMTIVVGMLAVTTNKDADRR